jgi:hypothetical protein
MNTTEARTALRRPALIHRAVERALAIVLGAALALFMPGPVAAAPASIESFWSSDVGTGWAQSAAVAPDGTLRVVYAASDGIWYARQDGTGAWTRTLVSNAVVSTIPRLALDSHGYAHVTYVRTDPIGIRYATDRFGTWREFQISGTNGDRNPAIAVDAEGEA